MAPVIFVCLLSRSLQHLRGQINTGHLTMRGICGERQPGPDSYLKNLGSWRDIKIGNDGIDAFAEETGKNLIVEMGELRINFALVGVSTAPLLHFRNHTSSQRTYAATCSCRCF